MNKNKAKHALECMLYRVNKTIHELDGEFPYFADPVTGKWTTTIDGNWCAGHFIVLLWLGYKYASNEIDRQYYRSKALEYTKKMTASLDKFKTSIFAGLNFNMVGFQGYDFSNNKELLDLGFIGADIIMNLYNERAQQIASGIYVIEGPQHELNKDITGKGWGWVTSGNETSAVDSAHAAIPVLLRAYKESNDLRYRDTALSHLEIYLKRFIRDDGSTRQLVRFDPANGKVVEEYKNLSSNVNGCWARGFGWCVSGLSEVLNNIPALRYQYALESLCDYYKTHSNNDLVPCWDMSFTFESNEPRDTSCAALVAYGLSSLKQTNESTAKMKQLGIEVMESLVDNYLLKDGDNKGMLLHGCYSKPKNYAYDNELIWSDYYLAMALDNYLEEN